MIYSSAKSKYPNMQFFLHAGIEIKRHGGWRRPFPPASLVPVMHARGRSGFRKGDLKKGGGGIEPNIVKRNAGRFISLSISLVVILMGGCL